jgi:hypothetical protein
LAVFIAFQLFFVLLTADLTVQIQLLYPAVALLNFDHLLLDEIERLAFIRSGNDLPNHTSN